MESICASHRILESPEKANQLTQQLTMWVQAMAKLTGIERTLLPGQSFRDVRRKEQAGRDIP